MWTEIEIVKSNNANRCQPILGKTPASGKTKSAAREKLEPRAGLFRVRGRAVGPNGHAKEGSRTEKTPAPKVPKRRGWVTQRAG